ncbi:hypothetical protein AYL99_11372 [Fonsecaea erecta]|uniref:Uncharacterized protein n=1 Tax=Fonsecaea erecta TaxID=1367422 RepID=A0A178Z401_9EURO|nr:hypothetical protein AYL99_11372 [Fonsecaea erecta]OAP54271.1 hypothetical protein AYL99_11372 [Fonsecaea erecta]
MASSHSDNIIDSIEKFWTINTVNLSNDLIIKILTAGVNNMLSIAKCAEDLIIKDAGLKAYLTYRRLFKVLEFVLKGSQSISKTVLTPKSLEDALEEFKGLLNGTLKPNLPQEDIVEDTKEIPNSSAIELLLELFYKAIPNGTENIYEFVLAFEARFGQYFTETNSCGLPRVVFICYMPGGMIATACAAKWDLAIGEPGKIFRYRGVNSKLNRMRRRRFQFASTKTAEKKFTEVKEAYQKGDGDDQSMSLVLEDKGFEPFLHQSIQGGAFRVLDGAGSILKIHTPCSKCRHLYHFEYLGQQATCNITKNYIPFTAAPKIYAII